MKRHFATAIAALFLATAVDAAEAISTVVPCPDSPQPGISVGGKASKADAQNPWRYPAQARRNREQGTVTLKLLLDDRGAAQRVSLVKGSGSSQLDRVATKAAKSVRFCPMQDDAPISAGVAVVRVTYSLTQMVAQL